jgi:hypothetical protein
LLTQPPRPSACPADCPGCLETEVDPISSSVPLAGWPLVATSLLAFLVPLLFALGGAVVSRSSPARQLLGCVAGFIIGMVVVRLLPAASSEREEEPE